MAHGKRGLATADNNSVHLTPAEQDISTAQLNVVAGQRDDAITILKNRVLIEPDAGNAHYALGKMYLQSADIAEAYEHFKTAATQLGDDARVWFDFARCLSAMRQFEAALVATNKAVKIGPATPDMYLGLGGIHHELGQTDEAIAAYDIVLLMSPGHGDALFRRALELQLNGDIEGARAGFRDVLESDPERKDARLHLANMGETGE